jgi:hypothetical protein
MASPRLNITWLSSLPAGIESQYQTFVMFRYANNTAMQFYLGWTPDKAAYHFENKVLKSRTNFEISEEGSQAIGIHAIFGIGKDCSLQFGDNPVPNSSSTPSFSWAKVVEGEIEDRKGQTLTVMHFNGGQSLQLYLDLSKSESEQKMTEFLNARSAEQKEKQGSHVHAYQMPFSEDGRLWAGSDHNQMKRLVAVLDSGPNPGESPKDFMQRVIGKHHPMYSKYLKKLGRQR